MLIKTMAIVLTVIGLAGGLAAQGDSEESMKLAVGDVAPDWTMQGSDGKAYKLSEFKGKQGVVVAWYPMALTGG